jgi:putative transposase
MKVVCLKANNKVAKWFENWYKRSVGIRRTKHAVYDLKYHLVWIPKYRKRILDKEVTDYLKEVFKQIAVEYGFKIDTMEVMEDHVHIFTEVPPRYSPAEVVQIMKGVSAREVFKKFPRLRKELWSGELWNDGYSVRSVGDKVTADIIRKYIEYQTHEDNSTQLNIFSNP